MSGQIMSAAYAMMLEKMSMKQNTPTVIEPITITENGTYTAKEGSAYSPVTVNVKSEGSIVAIPKTFTANGTYTAPSRTAYSPVTIAVPQIETVETTVNVNGTYSAPSGKAFSKVSVNVPTSGVSDVDELPDVSTSSEGTIVHLTNDYIDGIPVELFAFSRLSSSEGIVDDSSVFTTKLDGITEDDIVMVTDVGIKKYSEVWPDNTIEIDGDNLILDGETFVRHSDNDIRGIQMIGYYDDNSSTYMYLNADTSIELKYRVSYSWRDTSNEYTYYIFSSDAPYIDTISLDNDTLSITYKDPEWTSFIGTRNPLYDLIFGTGTNYYAGYYKVSDGKWVTISAPLYPIKVYKDMNTKYPQSIYFDTLGYGLMLRHKVSGRWEYAIWMSRYGWCDIYGGNIEINAEWFDSTTEVGYGLHTDNGSIYSVVAFVPCPYKIIEKFG